MSDPRYVVAAVHPHPEWPELTQLYRVLDLPDAEHIHIHRHPDGTITATPMRESSYAADQWVDCPTGGDQ